MKLHHPTPHDATPAPFLATAPMFDFGMPHDRAARVAARRAFVAMKRVYLDAATLLEGIAGTRLRRRVRLALEPSDLLALQHELLDALPQGDARTRDCRAALRRQFDEMFPDMTFAAFVPL